MAPRWANVAAVTLPMPLRQGGADRHSSGTRWHRCDVTYPSALQQRTGESDGPNRQPATGAAVVQVRRRRGRGGSHLAARHGTRCMLQLVPTACMQTCMQGLFGRHPVHARGPSGRPHLVGPVTMTVSPSAGPPVSSRPLRWRIPRRCGAYPQATNGVTGSQHVAQARTVTDAAEAVPCGAGRAVQSCASPALACTAAAPPAWNRTSPRLMNSALTSSSSVWRSMALRVQEAGPRPRDRAVSCVCATGRPSGLLDREPDSAWGRGRRDATRSDDVSASAFARLLITHCAVGLQ